MRLYDFLKNGTFDINCGIELYMPPKGMTWNDCSPIQIIYGNADSDEVSERLLNLEITYMTINGETEAIVIETADKKK